MLSGDFAENIRRVALVAKTLVDASGCIVYRVGPDHRLADLLLVEENEQRCQAYLSGFQADDPLAPTSCIANPAPVALLSQRLTLRRPAHQRYYRGFMLPFGLNDAAEMLVVVGEGKPVILGFSLLRDAPLPPYSTADLQALIALQSLAETALWSCLPESAGESGEVGRRYQLARRIPSLTRRELDVACAMAEGMSNKLIARQEGVAVSTVKTHVQNVLRKAGLSRRAEVARLASH